MIVFQMLLRLFYVISSNVRKITLFYYGYQEKHIYVLILSLIK